MPPLRSVLAAALPLGLVAALAWPGRHASVQVEDPQEIAPAVSPLSAGEIAQASATIDQLVEASHAKHNVQAMPVATDAQFLRRAYLGIIGRIPTADEAYAFLASTASTKREVLVDRLVASEGRVHHEFTFWADLLRVQSRLGNRSPGQPWIDWLKDSLRTNKPYDRMVREMVTASGPALAEGNGATGFYLRDQGMPLDRMANLSQTFLGTQIGCAQCHDHPFDHWKRREFFEFAAYLHGSDARRDVPGDKQARQALRKAMEELGPQERNVLRRIGDTIGVRVNTTVKATITLPEDYQYDDAKPKDSVGAKVIFGASPTLAKGDDPRAAFATWLTAPENPRFATVIANRLWKKAFGIGLIEPVDDLRNDTVASNPELMAYLSRLMVSLKYDLRAYQAILYKTRAWQRQAVRADLKPGEPFHFPGPLVRRLSAEQIWDSLLTLAVDDIDQLHGEDADHLEAQYLAYKDLTAEAMIQQVKAMSLARQQGEQLKTQFEQLRKQADQAKPQDAKNFRAQIKQLSEKRRQLWEIVEPPQFRPKSRSQGMLRAAELPQPAPAGHFLRVFGQSDRESIDNGTPSPAVTQALHLLNGPLAEAIAKADSPLQRTLAKATDEVSQTRALYLAFLGRQPDQDELKLAVAYLTRYGDEGRQDLAWALMNANEFLFLQ